MHSSVIPAQYPKAMVEVFRSDIYDAATAAHLLKLIHNMLPLYTATFDLEDCDRILRVQCRQEPVNADKLIAVFHAEGFRAEVLEDEYQIE